MGCVWLAFTNLSASILLLLMLRWMQPMELCRLGELQGEESTIQIWILMDKLTVDDKDQTWNALSKLRQRGWFGACWCCLSRKAMQCNALHSCFTESQSCRGACGGMVQYMALFAVRCEEPCVDACWWNSSDATFRSTRDTHSTSAAPHLPRKSTGVRHVQTQGHLL